MTYQEDIQEKTFERQLKNKNFSLRNTRINRDL